MAVNKALDTDCLFSTLKARLGLPDHMPKKLPEAPEVIAKAFTFEKEHSDLFGGRSLAQVGVFYSDKTRDHTFFGNIRKGYYRDYAHALRLFFGAGISADTLFLFPETPEQYAVVILPSALIMREEELDSMRRYLANVGHVLVCGPSCLPECDSAWVLPTMPKLNNPSDFFDTMANGVALKDADWIVKTELTPSTEPNEWKAVAEGILYNPHRIGDGELEEAILELVCKYVAKPPVEILYSKGYWITMFETEDAVIAHFLAEDYDTDIDHELDQMRFHRSRVNYINKVELIGIDRTVRLCSDAKVEVYTPFCEESAEVQSNNGTHSITLPEKTSYAIMKFLK